VAYRLALDHPDQVRRLAVLDLVPTGDAFGRADMRFALGFWPWSLLAQPAPLPERLIGADPGFLVCHLLDAWGATREAFPDELRAEYVRALTPEAIHAICEEYRAAATLDYEHDEADRGRRRIACPVLALWSGRGPVEAWYDPLAVWRGWADDVRGRWTAATSCPRRPRTRQPPSFSPSSESNRAGERRRRRRAGPRRRSPSTPSRWPAGSRSA
jgi:haloacetate dehalogenase